MAPSYQNPSCIKKTLTRSVEQLSGIESRFKDGILKYGKKSLSKEMYDSKMLEVVFPNTLISDNIAKELMEFKKRNIT